MNPVSPESELEVPVNGPYGEQYDPQEGIAIVGMAGRFPGASNVQALWANILAGRDSISRFEPATLDPSFREDMLARAEPGYVCARGLLDDVDCFDEAFFGFSPAEAALLDPQQRLFLQAAWEALEHAGHDPEAFDGPIGVFAGATANSYYLNNLLSRPDVTDKLGLLTTQMANQGHYIATRAAYKLNLRGPALNIHTACSTSLVAVCTAVQSLQNFQCDMALAGGVSVTLPQRRGYLHQEGSILSPDGVCRAFDEHAQGTVFSNGLGVVVLRRLADALQDGNTIYAVIKGAALNNDGHDKLSFTAPSVQGQAEVITMAQALAGIDPHTISYVEAHGTGTALGDPIEVAALTQAFHAGGARRPGTCALASLKSQIGHLDAAAGVAGLIRTALALHHRTLPASLHFTAPNPKLNLQDSPFYVNDQVRAWPAGPTPRRAGVSAFGVGGTNAHVVLEEAPAHPTSTPQTDDRDDASEAPQLLCVSARDEAALHRATQQLQAHLAAEPAERPSTRLADVAFTLQSGRRAFPWRRAWSCSDRSDALRQMASPATPTAAARDPLRVAFLFPGQGSQQVNVGRGLYTSQDVFRAELDACAEVLRAPLGCDVRDLLFPASGQEALAERQLAQTAYTQPAVLALQLALARQWMSWGLQPAALLGHSVGEYAAACLGGTFSRDDVLLLVTERARLMQELGPGAMLAVRAAPDALQSELNDGVDLAACNAPQASVLAGPADAVARVASRLDARGIGNRLLNSARAFHSSMMDPILAAYEERVLSCPRSAPSRPWISSLTGRLITDEQACSATYWVRQLREPVQFAPAMATCLTLSDALLEVGTGDTLTRLARQQPQARLATAVVASLPPRATSSSTLPSDGMGQLLNAAGQLWCAGASLSTQVMHPQARRRVPLPTYPFARNRHWVEAAPVTKPPATADAPVPAFAVSVDNALAVQKPSEPVQSPTFHSSVSSMLNPSSGRSPLLARLQALFADLAGMDAAALDPAANFLELGLDSLTLTQASQSLNKAVGVKVPMRALLEELTTLNALTDHLLPLVPVAPQSQLPAAQQARPAPAVGPAKADVPVSASASAWPGPAAACAQLEPGDSMPSTAWMNVFAQQLALMGQQLQMMRQSQPRPAMPAAAAVLAPGALSSGDQPVGAGCGVFTAPVLPPSAGPQAAAEAAPKTSDPQAPTFGPFRPPVRHAAAPGISAEQLAQLKAFTARYNAHTATSKQRTQEHRRYLADPRSVAGFRQTWKELVYPIVTVRSEGSALWDVDGHRYIDITNGFGMIMFGHNPPFVREAVERQLQAGYEIGPQTPLAGEVAKALCELVGMERAAFCATGSEAVMAAVRMARTVTGRDRIVVFAGAYHGIFDEVLMRPARQAANLAEGVITAAQGRAVPIAPGIPQAMADNILVLEYGTPQSLRTIEALGSSLAAVLVEPVQSRRPELQPREYLQELRSITEAHGVALVFDEVVTGFRCHPGGAQALFGVRADLATYGKVIGGGLPIGVVAGSARFLDALDGGGWQFGDDSAPEVGVTFFAGTFVRHPLALAAASAVLRHLRSAGPQLQQSLNERTAHLALALQAEAEELGVPLRVAHFSSWFCFQWPTDLPLAPLFYPALRLRGIHVWEGRPCFLTTAHSDADLQQIVAAVRGALVDLQAAGLLPSPNAPEPVNPIAGHAPRAERLPGSHPAADPPDVLQPPVPGARLGRDREGREAWFVPDPDRPGKYLQILDSTARHV